MRRLAIAALLLLGCEVDGTIGKHEPGGGSGGGTGGMDGSGTTAPEGTGAGSGGGGGTSDTDGSSSDSAGATGATTRDTATDIPHACIPTPDDGACSECRKMSCCGLLVECLAHETCTCWWDCLVTDHSSAECTERCLSDGLLYHELAVCAQMHCDTCTMD